MFWFPLAQCDFPSSGLAATVSSFGGAWERVKLVGSVSSFLLCVALRMSPWFEG